MTSSSVMSSETQANLVVDLNISQKQLGRGSVYADNLTVKETSALASLDLRAGPLEPGRANRGGLKLCRPGEQQAPRGYRAETTSLRPNAGLLTQSLFPGLALPPKYMCPKLSPDLRKALTLSGINTNPTVHPVIIRWSTLL